MIGPQELLVRSPAPEVSASGDITDALVLLDLDQPMADLDAVVASLAARTSVVVGIGQGAVDERLAAVLDLVLTEDFTEQSGPRWCVQVPSLREAMADLTAAVANRPRAALIVAAVLRQTALLPAGEAVAAEASGYSTLLAGPEFACWLADRGPARPPRPDDRDRLDVTREGDLLRVRLTRVVRRNAFDAAMRVALSEALQVAVLEPSLRVRLSGAGPVFSAGGDLDEFGTATDPATAWTVRTGDSPAHTLARLADRTEAFVHGDCAGAGVELPAFAGRVIADPGTTFRLPELQMGLLPGAGGTVSMTRRIGRWRTLWLALTGVRLDARTALDWGLVDALEARGD